MANLTPQELQAILDTLDDLCKQAQELQKQIRQKMVEAARRDYPSVAPPAERRKATRRQR